MASVVSNRRGAWEIRESRATPDGPRSRTLASFRQLDARVLSLAAERAERPFDPSRVERSARRVGAPVSPEPTERAARELVKQLSDGDGLSPAIAGAIAGLLKDRQVATLGPEAMAAARWAGADARERGRALYDLLLLADAIPNRRESALRFPRISAA